MGFTPFGLNTALRGFITCCGPSVSQSSTPPAHLEHIGCPKSHTLATSSAERPPFHARCRVPLSNLRRTVSRQASRRQVDNERLSPPPVRVHQLPIPHGEPVWGEIRRVQNDRIEFSRSESDGTDHRRRRLVIREFARTHTEAGQLPRREVGVRRSLRRQFGRHRFHPGRPDQSHFGSKQAARCSCLPSQRPPNPCRTANTAACVRSRNPNFAITPPKRPAVLRPGEPCHSLSTPPAKYGRLINGSQARDAARTVLPDTRFRRRSISMTPPQRHHPSGASSWRR